MEGIKYGYARVPTDEQTSVLQHAALKQAGRRTIFKDGGLPGATTKCPGLLRCLKKLEHGDTLMSGVRTGWDAPAVPNFSFDQYFSNHSLTHIIIARISNTSALIA